MVPLVCFILIYVGYGWLVALGFIAFIVLNIWQDSCGVKKKRKPKIDTERVRRDRETLKGDLKCLAISLTFIILLHYFGNYFTVAIVKFFT